ncbi:hypothetical protein ZEAMMB73_Zm00001d005097 [Zea mays]|nr:hypothetical protein ZEAMMB73_Zm00001d005097 [Zea mays]
MGQRKEFGMSFCQGRITILLSQSPLDIWESLAATYIALEAADDEGVGLCDRLLQADHRVMELESKVVGLHEGVDEVVAFVRAQGADRGE